jgi:hypothetical protein
VKGPAEALVRVAHDEHIHGSADVEASGLEEAVDLALEMLKAQYSPKCEFIEIWQGDQRLLPANRRREPRHGRGLTG